MEEGPEVNYNAAIEEYYKLKQEYDRTYKRKLRVLKNKDISLKEKRELLHKIKLPCIHCKKRVGTIFTNEGGVLKAVCGGTPQCSLILKYKRQTLDISLPSSPMFKRLYKSLYGKLFKLNWISSLDWKPKKTLLHYLPPLKKSLIKPVDF